MDLISKKTRNLFEDYFVTMTLREISNYFDNQNIQASELATNSTTNSERRNKVKEYYQNIKWDNHSDVQKVLNVYEEVIVDINEYSNSYQFDLKLEWLKRLETQLSRDGYVYQDYKLSSISQPTNFNDLTNATSIFDKTHFQEHIDRINKSINDDPALAIGSTKELVEATLKAILLELEIEIDKADDIPRLLKKVQKGLDIVPNEIDNSIKGAEIIKVLLNNLGSVVIKLTELRNLYGTGHGAEKKRNGLSPRHARLAVGAGITLSTFLLDTFEFKRTKK